MTDVENHTLTLLREMREENLAFQRRILQEFDDLKSKISAVEEQHSKKLDKLGVDIYAVRGRVKGVEDAVAMIARVVSEGTGA